MPSIYSHHDLPEDAPEPRGKPPLCIMILCENGFRFEAHFEKGVLWRTNTWLCPASEDLPAFLRQIAEEMDAGGLLPEAIPRLSLSPASDGYVAYINWQQKEDQNGRQDQGA